MTLTDEYPICPRCGGMIPNNLHPGKYPGAVSRVDDTTEICSGCGVDEALEQITTGRLNGDWLNTKGDKG